MVLFSCSNSRPGDAAASGETGVLKVSVYMEKVGALNKSMKTADIELTELYVTLSATDQPTVYDTLQLFGGSGERVETQTYPGLAAFVDGQFVEWTLYVETRDRNNRIVHSGDTTFTLTPFDTVQIPLLVSARYSMLVANYFPIRDSVTRCELVVDGARVTDSSFQKQSLLGDTVMLSNDYLAADPGGAGHNIFLNVYGDFEGVERMMYQGNIAIDVWSGEDTSYNVALEYVGPGAFRGVLTMEATLGRVGTTSINGRFVLFDKYFLTMTSVGNGTVSGSDSATHGIPHHITATPDSGWWFAGWQVTNGTATIEDPWANSTSVTLENGDAAVEGTFVETATDIDGNVYPVVRIGTQIWMTENLRTTRFNDGTSIPLVTGDYDWRNRNAPAYCWYNNDENSYRSTYGALYNWYAVSTGRLAPEGWHVATDNDWAILVSYLGGEGIAGGSLKEAGTAHWYSPNDGATNESGFLGLPGGYRYSGFSNVGYYGFWWTSSSDGGSYPWVRYLYYYNGSVSHTTYYNRYGLSVRCIRN